MTDDAIKSAQERMALLTQRIAETKNAINDANARLRNLENDKIDVERWIEMWHRFNGTPMIPVAVERIKNSEDTNRPKRPKNPDREQVAEEALAIIYEKRRALSRRELFEALRERGVIIRGKNPEMVLSTMLWRSKDKIVRFPAHGYWAADRGYPDAGYYPGADDLIGAAAHEPEDGIEAEIDEADDLI